jgi:hypothetical protein
MPPAWVGELAGMAEDPGAAGNTGVCCGAGWFASGVPTFCVHAVRLTSIATSTTAFIKEAYLNFVCMNL